MTKSRSSDDVFSAGNIHGYIVPCVHVVHLKALVDGFI